MTVRVADDWEGGVAADDESACAGCIHHVHWTAPYFFKVRMQCKLRSWLTCCNLMHRLEIAVLALGARSCYPSSCCCDAKHRKQK